jgi:hypothetical protein
VASGQESATVVGFGDSSPYVSSFHRAELFGFWGGLAIAASFFRRPGSVWRSSRGDFGDQRHNRFGKDDILVDSRGVGIQYLKWG